MTTDRDNCIDENTCKRSPNANSTNCSNEEDVCEEHNLTGCTADGKMIGTFPDERCLNYPDNDKCAAVNYECPKGFLISNSANWTSSRGLPSSYNDARNK